MRAGHTPGPWEAVDSMTIRGPFEHGNPEKPGFFVASLPASRAEGDAQLIAAAPELLNALIAAVDWANPMQDAPKSSRPEWFDTARASIAKAYGGAQ